MLPPVVGAVSGGLTAAGATPRVVPRWELLALGAVAITVLNSASNALNQIFDCEIDRINKPARPLPSGRIQRREVWAITITLYLASLLLAWQVNREFFLCFLAIAVATYLYSAPPARTKRWGLGANVTIAIPRGVLLKVAGWSTVKTVADPEPWLIGGIIGLFLLGATTTKDFADIEGDRAHGCATLPVRYGVRASAWAISPFFVLPFLLIPAGALSGVLTGNPWALSLAGLGLAAWGVLTICQVLKAPERLSTDANHPSWRHMYLMMMATHVGFAVAYAL
jgi:4-hydroxybenzoate polyprenyltransferase